MTSNIMLSTSLKWVYLLCIFLSCCIEHSCGFQASGAFGKRRNQHSHDPFQSSCVPSLTLESKGLSQVALNIRKVISNRYPYALRLSRLSIENAVLQSQRPPRYDISLSELRLHASPSDDEQSSPSNKFRSVLTKVVKGLTFPVRFGVLKPLRWIRSKLQSKEKVAVENETSIAEPLYIQESVAGATDVLEIIKAKTELPGKTEEKIEQSIPTAESLVEPDVQAEQEPAISETVVEIVEKAEEKKPAKKQKVKASGKPAGDRWAIAAPKVDLSGDWTLVVNEDFRKQYDEYLKQLGQPFLVRSVALTIIALTTEETQQTDEGRTLLIRGTNARGIWERNLVASGTDLVNDQYTPLQVPIVTADDERVEAEAWWEEEGTVHRSWMRGLNKYGGGDFESRRYLEDGGRILVCESTFHPREKDRKDASVTWRFLRNGEQLAIDET